MAVQKAELGRRALLRSGGALAAAKVVEPLRGIARAEDGLPSVTEYERNGVKVLETTLEHGQGILIGGQPFTVGTFNYRGIELGGRCEPYAAVLFADRTHRVVAQITGAVHYETFNAADLDFDQLVDPVNGPIRTQLKRAVKQVNDEAVEDTSNLVPATHIFGGLVTQADGRPQMYPVVRRKHVNARFDTVAAPTQVCPPTRPGAPVRPPEAPAAPQPGVSPKVETAGIVWGDEDHFNTLDGKEIPMGDAASWMLVTGWDGSNLNSTFQLRVAPGMVVRVKGVIGSDWHVWGKPDTPRWDQMNQEVLKRDQVNPTVITVISPADASLVAERGWTIQPFPRT